MSVIGHNGARPPGQRPTFLSTAALYSAQPFCQLLLYSFLSMGQLPILCRALTGSDTVNALLNKQEALVQRPLSHLMGSKYMERVTGRYANSRVDTSAIFDMLSAQQWYRRGALHWYFPIP